MPRGHAVTPLPHAESISQGVEKGDQANCKIRMVLRCAHGAALLKTLAAKNGAALRGAERNGGLLAALRATGLGFRAHGRGGAAATLRTLGFATFAAFWFVLKAFVGEEHLFPAGKYKLGATFRTLQHPIVVFHSRNPPDLTSGKGRGLGEQRQGEWVCQQHFGTGLGPWGHWARSNQKLPKRLT